MPPAISDSTGLPPDLAGLLTDFDNADLEARRIAGTLSDAQINWRPSETAWSIAQCLDHLGRGNTIYAAALQQAVQEARVAPPPRKGPLRPGWLSRLFIWSLEPPPRIKMQAPGKIVPAVSHKGDEVLEMFLRSQEDMRAVLQESASLDLNRIRFRNPFIVSLRFTVGAGLLIIAAHNRRHLWQAEQVRQAPGFPPD
jgi:hypothetical protein